jgi:molybdenum cofactor cytidylyltransferase
MKTELILLAAGQSKRFGGVKQLADIQGQPMVCHCLSKYRDKDKWISGVAHGYVALGANAALIAKVLPDGVDNIVVNSWRNGLGYTLAQSISALASDTTHVMIGLADQVTLTTKIISRLLDTSRLQPGHIIAAKYSGGIGVPAIFPKQYFSKLSQLTGDKGAKILLQQHYEQVSSIDIPEAAFDIDTAEDLNQL